MAWASHHTTASHAIPGGPLALDDKVLEGGASALQDFKPVKQICAHLNAFHVYASAPERLVETNHYCTHLTSKVRQCLLYDSAEADARLIGIEYMITPDLFETLEKEERRLWHSHVFEVKSGMLIMPGPTAPGLLQAWEAAETLEMEKVVQLYGKVYHLWQTDRGDTLPLGEAQLMTSFTNENQFDFANTIAQRDKRFGVDAAKKKALRAHIAEPEIHPDADYTWKRRNSL